MIGQIRDLLDQLEATLDGSQSGGPDVVVDVSPLEGWSMIAASMKGPGAHLKWVLAATRIYDINVGQGRGASQEDIRWVGRSVGYIDARWVNGWIKGPQGAQPGLERRDDGVWLTKNGHEWIAQDLAWLRDRGYANLTFPDRLSSWLAR